MRSYIDLLWEFLLGGTPSVRETETHNAYFCCNTCNTRLPERYLYDMLNLTTVYLKAYFYHSIKFNTLQTYSYIVSFLPFTGLQWLLDDTKPCTDICCLFCRAPWFRWRGLLWCSGLPGGGVWGGSSTQSTKTQVCSCPTSGVRFL